MNRDSLWLVMSILGRILRPYINWGFGVLSDYKKRSRMTTVSKNSSLEEKEYMNLRQLELLEKKKESCRV